MRTHGRVVLFMIGAIFVFLVHGSGGAGNLSAKEKTPQISPDDPTLRLYSLLDSKFNGKLDGFVVLADVVNDPKISPQPQQRVLSVDYNKDHAFGKLNIRVRSVGQLTPDQMKTYTPKQIFDFGETDAEKFTKTDPGPFGRPGDVFFEPAADGGAMGSVNATPEVQAEYERFLTQYLIPALEKKAAGGSGS